MHSLFDLIANIGSPVSSFVSVESVFTLSDWISDSVSLLWSLSKLNGRSKALKTKNGKICNNKIKIY